MTSESPRAVGLRPRSLELLPAQPEASGTLSIVLEIPDIRRQAHASADAADIAAARDMILDLEDALMSAIDTARFCEMLVVADPQLAWIIGRVTSGQLSIGNALAEVAEMALAFARAGDRSRLVSVFRIAEQGLVSGTETVKDAVATQFLEALQHASDDEVARIWVPLLGEESRAYCRAWDEFSGVRTPSLW